METTTTFTYEIFITNFFHNIGILAPRTNLVKVKFNGKIHDMLFQEKISKEFLEINGHTILLLINLFVANTVK